MIYKEIAADEVQRRLEAGERLLVVDIREPQEWRSGVIPEARLSPMRTFLQLELDPLDKDQEVVLVCHSGGRTAHAAAYMGMQGFANARSMAGGMLAWKGPVVPPGAP